MARKQNSKERKMTHVRLHELGMGWHYIWRYDPPIEHRVHREDGTPYYWREVGESSEGCILWLADRFAMQVLGKSAREIYGLAYREKEGEDFEDDWVATEVLRDQWADYTVLPEAWTPAQIVTLFEDLEAIDQHEFLTKLIELVQQHMATLAAKLRGWCEPAPPPADPAAAR